jgi:hypothetical protein
MMNAPKWQGPADQPVRALCRRHEIGGAGGGWDEQIKGGLTKLSAVQLAVQMGLSRNARLGDQLVGDRRHRGIPCSTAAAT